MKKINKKLLLVVEPKDATFSKQQLEKNAVLFNEHMLKKFSSNVMPLLNSVTTEWVRVSDEYILDDISKKNFNYYFREL